MGGARCWDPARTHSCRVLADREGIRWCGRSASRRLLGCGQKGHLEERGGGTLGRGSHSGGEDWSGRGDYDKLGGAGLQGTVCRLDDTCGGPSDEEDGLL